MNERVVRNVVREKIMDALKKVKGGKAAAGVDGIVVALLKSACISISDWSLRVFNRCMESGVVPEEWKAACTVPVYRCTGKIYGKVLISSDRKYEWAGSEGAKRI